MKKDEVQIKFEYFFIGLIFSVLGLSIQTADFESTMSFVKITEIFGWFVLLASGIVGLNKLEGLPKLVLAGDYEQNQKEITRQFTEQAMKNPEIQLIDDEGKLTEKVNVSTLVSRSKEREKIYEEVRDELADNHQKKNTFQRWSFYTGTSLLVVSRSTDQIIQLVCNL